MKIIHLMLIMLLLLFVIGCSQELMVKDVPIVSKETNIGELFTLNIGDSVIVTDANMEITLQDANDYRCPEDVMCFYAGDFVANVILKNLETGEIKKKTFSADTGAGFDSTVFKGLVIRPIEWKPEKRLAGIIIENSSYEITFVVERGIAFGQQFIMEFDDTVPLGDGSIQLSLDNITIEKNENQEPKKPLSEATLHFRISKDTKTYSAQVNYEPLAMRQLPTELGEYQIFLKELIGKQPYYHRFDRYGDEVTYPTQYRARILVVQT